MNLSKKKELAAKTLKVGKNRVVFNTEGLSEIKEAITKQDIKSLHQEGIIGIKQVQGRKKIKRRKTRRGPGKIKKKVNNRKQVYVKITRKLRGYIMDLRDKGKIDRELYWDLRKKIRMRNFRSKSHLKEYLSGSGIKFELERKKASESKKAGKGKVTSKTIGKTKKSEKKTESSAKKTKGKSDDGENIKIDKPKENGDTKIKKSNEMEKNK